MKTSKLFLVRFGTLCLNLRLQVGVRLVDWVFKLSPTLRAA